MSSYLGSSSNSYLGSPLILGPLVTPILGPLFLGPFITSTFGPLLFFPLVLSFIVVAQMKAVSTVVADVEKALKIISDDLLIELCNTYVCTLH